jgi:hypothetical protein
MTISNMKFHGMDSLQSPLYITFDISLKYEVQRVGPMVFFNPLISIFGDFLNSWIKDERTFPIDLGCPSMDVLNCVIHLPENYRVEELPKTAKIVMSQDGARFTYGINPMGNNLQFNAELHLKKNRFEPDEYPMFREFYTQLNKKCNEMVILKVSQE